MIEKMHNKTNSLAFKIIFALIAISFVLGGIGGGIMMAGNYAAKVNGEEISLQAFNVAKARQQNLLNEQMGERFWDLMDTPEYAQEFNRSVLNQLINEPSLPGASLPAGKPASQAMRSSKAPGLSAACSTCCQAPPSVCRSMA